ncbi:HlyD family type I secretion periplasmic adaptor subunit [Chelativorans sp. M5D2P16]|uniref:HlyD family type I secretion periplasmic adaptor subunit n=1 Tax=Chelativorans sp. M5D2P16 TaxID=3095678 RepID=UPI002AC9FA5B|nr:HlyD family type I secretion periplasmic adaptor subunit [Chelativorans sp. M5D2P16]MDZ5695738.1 HlyD family type I secretion periplasmic adaptor subunit [Chelativorans sp. M5D2P16]
MTDSLDNAAGESHVAGRLLDNPLAKAVTQRSVLWLTVLAVLIFFLWAANAPLDEVTRGMGKVAPLSRGQVIQSLEGGIVADILVREGEEVSAGQVLAVLNDAQIRAAYRDLNGQVIQLRASLSRLHAEQDGADEVQFDAETAKHPEVVEVERELFVARQRNFIEAIATLEERQKMAQRELDLVGPMVERGAASVVDEIQLQRVIADLRGELAKTRNGYFQEINTEITERSAKLHSLEQQLAQKRDALKRTEMRSPVRGIVKNLRMTTRGGVIAPGETIMEIVPLDDQLYVEAQIRPRDVAFLRPGLPATVKITAYDFSIYGALSGELVFISADTIRDETRTDSEPYYRVRVLTDSAYLEGPDGPLPIKPGMVAEVDIQTGSKTVLDYLLKPILKGQQALSER